MKFINKLERKFGRYAIHNLMYYIIILYGIGVVVDLIMPPGFYSQFLSLKASAVLSGQIWRIVTFLIQPPDSSIIFVIFALYLYYMIGTELERRWGAFRFNLYFFTGVFAHIIVAILLYLLTGYDFTFNTSYLNLSLFFAFAAVYPDIQFLLFFIIPVKVKYLAWINGALFAYEILSGLGKAINLGNPLYLIAPISAILSILNFLFFFFATRNYSRMSPKDIHRRKVYKQQVQKARNVTKHKCAICGRTEEDGEHLEFRFCSKCDGNYEYCQDHLFTHTHVKKP